MEGKNSKNNFNYPAVIVTALILVFVGGYFLLNKNSSTQQDNTQQAEIDTLKKTVEDLKNQKSTPTSPTITNIVKEWSSVISIVVCNFRDSNGTITESVQGSGILYQTSSGILGVLTNKHVLGKYGVNNTCEIQFPDDTQVFTTTNADVHTFGDVNDATEIQINNPNANLQGLINTSKKKFCSAMPSIGDQIVILGYPAIGASSGITATEGIISGYDGDYYVTSAKVDHGNSGGVAIDIKNNCDLGIPTFVESGSLESLARILKWQIIAVGQEQKALDDKL